MTTTRHGSAVVEYPSALEILTTREFDAPIALVFDVLTKPEHVRNWFAPFEDRMTECSIDLRVGGGYRIVFVTGEGREMTFRGTYSEVEPPIREPSEGHRIACHLAVQRLPRDIGSAA